MNELGTLHIRLLTILMKSANGLDAFTAFQRTQTSFTIFSSSARQLKQYELIEENENRFLKITAKGIEALNKTTKRSTNKSWRLSPERFNAPKIEVDAFYIPSRKLLDIRPFQNSSTRLVSKNTCED